MRADQIWHPSRHRILEEVKPCRETACIHGRSPRRPSSAFGRLRPQLEVGEAAPDFELSASDGVIYTLEQCKGKQGVILAWFPKAFTRTR